MKAATPAKQLASFLAKFSPETAREAKKALAKVRKLVPGAIELVYDNYNALVIGFGPTERPSEAILSLAIVPKYVNLCFIQNAGKLPDPSKILLGSGKVARHIKLESAAELDRKDVLAILRAALKSAKTPINPKQKRQLIIRSISAKQRPRRKP